LYAAAASVTIHPTFWQPRHLTFLNPVSRSTISLDTDLRYKEGEISNVNVSVSGPAEGARRATGGGPETGRGGKGRLSAKRKASVVLELLHGADLESTSRNYGVTAATLTEWRDAFLAAGAEGPKIRQEELVDEQGRRMKSVIAGLAMENELLRERIRRMEDEKPFLRWRSTR
jgi:transposase-like protein